MADLQSQLFEWIAIEDLPESFLETIEAVYGPLAQSLAARQCAVNKPLMVGINGPQGAGKSTMARGLALILRVRHQLPTLSLSMDDLYLTLEQRLELAHRVHPLLKVRGPPGTHDIALGMALFDRLLSAAPNEVIPIPAFDKALDDRKPEEHWPQFVGRPAVIILEGWCVAAVAEAEASLKEPINWLERELDGEGVWRRFVNRQLGGDYRHFFDRLTVIVQLLAPGWEPVFEWRRQQEIKLQQARYPSAESAPGIMNSTQLSHFIQHFERITRHSLKELPTRADYVLHLDEERRIIQIDCRAETSANQ